MGLFAVVVVIVIVVVDGDAVYSRIFINLTLTIMIRKKKI